MEGRKSRRTAPPITRIIGVVKKGTPHANETACVAPVLIPARR
jgi:hypothetical protein